MENETSALRQYLFHEGSEWQAYRYLGAHIAPGDGERLYTFRTFAPHAKAVFLLGIDGDWERGRPLLRITADGIYELTFTDSRDLRGTPYKFRIESEGGTQRKGDPYAFASRGGRDGASLLTGLPAYPWQDADYLAARKRAREDGLSAPISIYEVHLGSFLRNGDGSFLNYRELGECLLAYVKYMGYTHIELLPIAEHPFDGSWGYQICAGYAPTARFGTPEDLCALVDMLHRGGVGVILDWVPAHFPKDEWGLFEFDGSPLYEYREAWRRESPWGSCYFDLSRREVRSFLISNAVFWLKEYHIDGLRVDAVASMLYLDYDRAEGEWERSAEGDNKNREAEAFLRALNTAVHAAVPEALMIAEESTAWPRLTHPTEEGGLGFDMKWNMGFSNDLFGYLSAPPEERPSLHAALNFPITYAFSERYVLPISHDEVVYGKRSFFSKLFGTYEEKLATFRTALLFFMTFPGKKLMFMGTEYGEEREWDHDGSLPLETVNRPPHDDLREYTAALNRLYLETPALYEGDFLPEGFSWLLPDEAARSLVAYRRKSREGSEVIAVLTFTGRDLGEVAVPTLAEGEYRVLFETRQHNGGARFTVSVDGVLTLPIPSLYGVLLERCEDAITI